MSQQAYSPPTTEPARPRESPGRVGTRHRPSRRRDVRPVERPAPDATTKAISELRRTAGLNWDQLAQLFGVSQRSVHFWASGRQMDVADAKHLFETLDVVLWADRGSARSNRVALFTMSAGKTPFDLLAAKAFDEARSRLGRGRGRRRVKLGPLDPQAELERRPLPPEALIDAMNDRIHKDIGGGRAARTVRNMRLGATD